MRHLSAGHTPGTPGTPGSRGHLPHKLIGQTRRCPRRSRQHFGAASVGRPLGSPPWSARSRLVEHSNPAHANPTAQVPAARRDDRPATRRRTTGRKHRFIDRIRAPHNRCIATPINARNGRPEELDRGYTPLRGLRRRRHCGGAGTAADLRRLWSGGGPTPARPIGETADQRLRAPKGRRCTMHNQTPITYTTIQNLYLFFICSCYTISIQARVIVCIVQAKG